MINITSLSITQEVLNTIAEIDEFKGAWKATGMLAPERLKLLRKVATVESIGSSTRIEGSQLSDQEVKSLLGKVSIQNFQSRDEQEVAGYADVMEVIFESFEEVALSISYIKQLHRDLLKYSDKDTRHRGDYKKSSNSVSAFDQAGREIGVVFETASPFDTPRLMDELFEWVNVTLETKSLHPLLTIAIFIVVFLEIHPFQDGNGRLSRVLTNLLLLKLGYTYTPYSSLESVIESSKEEYYQALRETQKTIRAETPNWQPWILYFIKSLKKQKLSLEKKLKREQVLLRQVPELSVRILDHVKAHGRVSMGEMLSITGESRNTLKEHFRALVKKRQLFLHGKGRGAWYSLVPD